MKAYRDKILSHKIQLWVRRGGPNYQEGLAAIREAGVALGIPTHVHGPETHMTAIVPMALMYVDPSFKYTSSAATGDGKASRPIICPRYGPSYAQDVCPHTREMAPRCAARRLRSWPTRAFRSPTRRARSCSGCSTAPCRHAPDVLRTTAYRSLLYACLVTLAEHARL